MGHSKWSSDGWPLGAVWVVGAVGGWVSPCSNSTPGFETSPSRWLRARSRATTAPITSSDTARPTHSSRRRPRRRGAMVRQASGTEFLPVTVDVLATLRAAPGGGAVLDRLGARDDVRVFGGAVRDALLGREPKDLDLVIAGDAAAL